MLSVRGTFDGKRVKLTERFDTKESFEVIVTFVEPIKKDLGTKKRSVDNSFGIWGNGESGIDYVNRIRDESEARLREVGIG